MNILPDRINQRIDALWGTDTCRSYLLELITDTRENSRKGFPRAIMSHLLELLEKHDGEFPGLIPEGLVESYRCVIFHTPIK